MPREPFPPLYPVNVVVQDRPCLVVGGGRVAAQKVAGLLECGARVHVVATEVRPPVRAIEGITWEERPFAPADVTGCWLVMAATDDPAANRAVHEAGEAAGVWVNSADDTDNCSFILPSRIRRGPLLVTFSTSGEAPSVARWMRRTYAGEFGDEWVAMIDIVAEERRKIQAEGRTTEGLNWQEAFDSGTLDLIREGRLAEAKERLQACLSSSSD
jgi:precorrin-2 dehydrogenase/sirohydrochlorin ferrochelatase